MALVATDLVKTYPGEDGPVAVLSEVSITLEPGVATALTGESGSGKSTLMHLLGLLDRADAGTLSLDGRDLTQLGDKDRAALRRSSVGLVFQQFTLIPSLDIAANIALQARLAGQWDAAWGADLSERLGLSPFLQRYPEQLSGGQQQRVAIARALAARPKILLADEPTGNLDEATSDRVMDLLLELTEKTGAALLVVTHSGRVAGRLQRRLHLRQGQLTEHPL